MSQRRSAPIKPQARDLQQRADFTGNGNRIKEMSGTEGRPKRCTTWPKGRLNVPSACDRRTSHPETSRINLLPRRPPSFGEKKAFRSWLQRLAPIQTPPASVRSGTGPEAQFIPKVLDEGEVGAL